MALTSNEQFKKFLEDSKDILILIPENPSADAVGSAWALYFFLENKKLTPTIAFSNNLSEKYSFLPKPQSILSQISGARDFVLSFDISRNKITGLKSEEKDGKFIIYLTPEKGSIDPRDFSFILAKFKYDLIIVLDSPDLEKLGKIYTENTDLFFEVPVINIDRRSDNDNFGQINVVDVTASSCAEILANLLESIVPSLVDKTVATCLLSGIIGATDSFQKKNTTPKSFATAATLMDKGADQQEIVRWFYKTHPLHILKLWGRAMAKLNWNPDTALVWSEISLEDFIQSRANPADLALILEKLQESYCEGKIFMTVFNDTPESSMAYVKTTDLEMAKKIYLAFGGEIRRGVLEIRLEKRDLAEVGKAVAEKIKKVV
jgi:nanoRNase/pAp phosphatase (c-di-AMP/oligoRNAs hydrolase)